ncbi:MAG: DUF3021 domain-containing protein [bacterium]|nr:DUF3021 domain-containing protein [bacterium]MCM1374519.1 DUF3021 domain-containing protein [Muribaculum sp.]
MKQLVKLVVKYILSGISIGCTFFVIMCLSYFVVGGETLLLPIVRDFARQSMGAVIVGIACGGTAVVYQFDRPSGIMKIVIHFCVGMGVFYPTGIYLGWIPFFPDRIFLTILQFLFSCVIFVGIWFCFYLFNRNEAKRINQRLRELERDNAASRV